MQKPIVLDWEKILGGTAGHGGPKAAGFKQQVLNDTPRLPSSGPTLLQVAASAVAAPAQNAAEPRAPSSKTT